MQYLQHKPKQQMESIKTFTVYAGSHHFLAEAFEVNFRIVHSIFAGITSLPSCQLQTKICKEQVNLETQYWTGEP